jgi:hypothetical protein
MQSNSRASRRTRTEAASAPDSAERAARPAGAACRSLQGLRPFVPDGALGRGVLELAPWHAACSSIGEEARALVRAAFSLRRSNRETE